MRIANGRKTTNQFYRMFRHATPRARKNRQMIPINYRVPQHIPPQQNRKFSMVAGGGPNFDGDVLKILAGLIGASAAAIIISNNKCE